MLNIQQITEQFIKKLLERDIIEKGIDAFIELSLADCKRYLQALIALKLEQVDEVLVQHPDYRKTWKVLRNQERHLISEVGEIQYTRRYYQNVKTKQNAYLVDQVVGIESHQRVTKELMAKASNLSANHSYQQTSALACSGQLSKQSIKNISRRAALPQAPFNVQGPELNVLHLQMDEDHIAGQDGKNRELRLCVVHESLEKHAKKNVLTNKRVLIARQDESLDEYWDRIWFAICENYNLSEHAVIYIHGDGAAWIKHGVDLIDNARFVLDKFHAIKYLKKIAPEETQAYKTMLQCLYVGDRLQFKKTARIQIGLYEDKRIESQEEGMNYILRQWPGIKIWSDDLNSGRSCAEGLVSHILSARLSSRPMAWLDKGMYTIGAIRELHQNGGKLSRVDFKRQASDKDFINLVESLHIESVKQAAGAEFSYNAHYTKAIQVSKNSSERRLFKQIIDGGYRF